MIRLLSTEWEMLQDKSGIGSRHCGDRAGTTDATSATLDPF